MLPFPPEVYQEDPAPLPRVYRKAIEGIDRANSNKCGKFSVGVVLLLSATCLVRHNLESPISLVELQLILLISAMAYCLALCAIARQPVEHIHYDAPV